MVALTLLRKCEKRTTDAAMRNKLALLKLYKLSIPLPLVPCYLFWLINQVMEIFVSIFFGSVTGNPKIKYSLMSDSLPLVKIQINESPCLVFVIFLNGTC